ncbi:hypothetical protein E2C01_020178 [Portunus trituberculatus]|uniref:Uncharacterized protein n=1 Tax=Portunus trituberculatus TaxID=210409 RepID=A0A5B7E1L1_PORTR|nr:hypothetical protein [Portunus trituberculatus]
MFSFFKPPYRKDEALTSPQRFLVFLPSLRPSQKRARESSSDTESESECQFVPGVARCSGSRPPLCHACGAAWSLATNRNNAADRSLFHSRSALWRNGGLLALRSLLAGRWVH